VAGPPAVAGPARPADSGPPPVRRPQLAWTPLVVASAATLGLALVALAVSWLATKETRISSYAVRGQLARVELDVRSGNIEIADAGGSNVQVRRTDRFAYGRSSVERRNLSSGVLRINSRCPSVVVGSCSADYRVAVPDNVPVVVRTSDGDVHVDAFRGSAQIQTGEGNVSVDAFCGFSLSVKTGSGNARTAASCSPQSLNLRSRSGSLDVTVPSGSYRVDADSNTGRRDVTGVTPSPGAPFEIQALSDSGDVTVRGGA
jgi:DUF4097 and DUF4098 domain-containing protein YvlB